MANETAVKLALNKAMKLATSYGLGVIGFVVEVKQDGLVFQPFASSQSLKEDQFVELIAQASRQMIGYDENATIN